MDAARPGQQFGPTFPYPPARKMDDGLLRMDLMMKTECSLRRDVGSILAQMKQLVEITSKQSKKQ